MEIFFAYLLLILLSPLFGVLFVVVKLTSKGPFIFKQARAGKNQKPFTIYKIRTMYLGAELDQGKFKKQNESDGPVFKIRNDPRFTRIGKFLTRSGMDELPQLVNIIKREMAFVGPRPLPINEARLVPKKYHRRYSVLPGITSTWVINGSHRLSFDDWMKLDCEYAEDHSSRRNFIIALQTIWLLLKSVFQFYK